MCIEESLSTLAQAKSETPYHENKESKNKQISK
jgi:hypothetical protein